MKLSVPIEYVLDGKRMDQAYSLFNSLKTLCFEGEKLCPGEALPGWDRQAQTVTKEDKDEEGWRSRREIDRRRTSKRGINLQDFFIPAREWVSLGELAAFLNYISSSSGPVTKSVSL